MGFFADQVVLTLFYTPKQARLTYGFGGLLGNVYPSNCWPSATDSLHPFSDHFGGFVRFLILRDLTEVKCLPRRHEFIADDTVRIIKDLPVLDGVVQTH